VSRQAVIKRLRRVCGTVRSGRVRRDVGRARTTVSSVVAWVQGFVPELGVRPREYALRCPDPPVDYLLSASWAFRQAITPAAPWTA